MKEKIPDYICELADALEDEFQKVHHRLYVECQTGECYFDDMKMDTVLERLDMIEAMLIKMNQ